MGIFSVVIQKLKEGEEEKLKKNYLHISLLQGYIYTHIYTFCIILAYKKIFYSIKPLPLILSLWEWGCSAIEFL